MLFVFFILGAIVASFVGVVTGRLHTGHTIVSGRSRCDACDSVLSPLSLMPIFSYLFSGGRSYCCHARLSLYAPLTELLLGGLFVLSYLRVGLTLALPFLLIALSLLLALVLYDLMHQILPPTLLWPFVLVSLVTGFLTTLDMRTFQVSLLTALIIGFFFVAMHVLSRGRAMGLADAPLAFGLSLLVGGEWAPAGLMFSFWIGAIVGITILLQRPRGHRMGVEVPFAPYLAAGFLLAYCIIQWNPLALLM